MQRSLGSRTLHTFRTSGVRGFIRKVYRYGVRARKRIFFHPHTIDLHVYDTDLHFYIGDPIGEFWYSHFEPMTELGWIFEHLRPGDLLVDCGAHHGIISLLAAKKCGANVIAVEASPSSVEILRRNVQLNQATVRVIHAAVSDRDGKVGFSNDSCGSVDESDGAVIVDSVALDTLLTGTSPRVLKIDVEGAELQALRGARKTIHTLRPILDLEVHSAMFSEPLSVISAIFEDLAPLAYRYEVQFDVNGDIFPLTSPFEELAKKERFLLFCS